MNLLPVSTKEFKQQDYWDTFFKKRGNKAFEWYGEYLELADQLNKYVKIQDDILIVGCGNSSLGRDMYDLGYNKIVNIDVSPVVIKQMQAQHSKDRPNLKYVQMDALGMTFENNSFSVVIDKGTLDALMPDNKPQTIKEISSYFKEVDRVLRVGGRYICISLLQEHILKILLDYFPKKWLFRIVRCFEVENKAINEGESALPTFCVVCTKFVKELPHMVLEVSTMPQEADMRVKSKEDVLERISAAQRATFACSGIQRNSLADVGEVSFELFKPGDKSPRYAVYVVDVPTGNANVNYACFIVPNGSESEWVYSTKAGREKLVEQSNHDRLAIVLMQPGQQYGDLNSVQCELADVAVTLAPKNFKNRINFLSAGLDIRERIVRHRGSSEISGDYIIEDVKNSDGVKLRRLYFLGTRCVIQSEAKLLAIKSRRGKSKESIDPLYLSCNHHIYMSIATCMACKNKQKASIALIGLGGGGLCSFLRKFLPNVSVIAVDIDKEMLKVATTWFGLQINSNLIVKIEDGIEYLKKTAALGQKLDAILFDVDSKDISQGISCPPKQFLDNKVLLDVKQCLGEQGLFVLNLVLRDESLRPSILCTLNEIFMVCLSYKLEDDLNEVFICAVDGISESQLLDSYKAANEDLNSFFVKNKLDEVITDLSVLRINK